MGEAGWSGEAVWFLLAAAFALGVALTQAFSGSRGRSDMVVASRGDPPQVVGPQVTSMDLADDDVMIFQCSDGSMNEAMWESTRDFFNNSIVGRFPEELAPELRRRVAVFPPGVRINVLHIRRQARRPGELRASPVVEKKSVAS